MINICNFLLALALLICTGCAVVKDNQEVIIAAASLLKTAITRFAIFIVPIAFILLLFLAGCAEVEEVVRIVENAKVEVNQIVEEIKEKEEIVEKTVEIKEISDEQRAREQGNKLESLEEVK